MAEKQADKPHIDQVVKEANPPPEVANGEFINASGHIQEVDRNFGLLSLAGFGLVIGNVWPALGGTLLVAIFNGGPPGAIYEL